MIFMSAFSTCMYVYHVHAMCMPGETVSVPGNHSYRLWQGIIMWVLGNRTPPPQAHTQTHTRAISTFYHQAVSPAPTLPS